MRRSRILLAGGVLPLLFLAALVLLCPKPTAVPPPAPAPVALPSLADGLAALPDGAAILVDETLTHLAPTRLKTYPHLTVFRDAIGFFQPDDRVNPATVDYLLGVDNPALAAVIFAEPPLWTPVARRANDDTAGLLLLKRACPVDEQLAPPMSDDAFARELAQMAAVPFSHGQPARKTTFLLDRYEATTAQYAHFLNEVGAATDDVNTWYAILDPASKIAFHRGRYAAYRGAERYPVFNVSYHGARAFCEHYGKHLPTVDQWRQAGGHWDDGREFPWGGQRDFARRGNFVGDDDGYALWAPVGAFPAGQSPYGIFNMAGNVFEWVGEKHALFGGSFEHAPEPLGTFSAPAGNDPLARNRHDGFRCAKD